MGNVLAWLGGGPNPGGGGVLLASAGEIPTSMPGLDLLYGSPP
jgi:hypothetical protein